MYVWSQIYNQSQENSLQEPPPIFKMEHVWTLLQMDSGVEDMREPFLMYVFSTPMPGPTARQASLHAIVSMRTSRNAPMNNVFVK